MMRRNRGFLYAPNAFAAFGAFGSAGQPVRFGHRITVQSWEQGLLYRDGALVEQVGPGSRRVWRSRCQLRTVDTRPQVVAVPTQEIPTADGVPVKVTAVAMTTVVDAVAHVSGTQDPDQVLYLAVQVALREVISTTSVEQLVEARAELPDQLVACVRGIDELGLRVDRVEVKDVVLPSDLKRAQAQVLVARAEGLAALERARGETAALRTLVNAARLTEEHPALLQLRLLQQLSASSGHTVVIGSESMLRPVALGASPTT